MQQYLHFESFKKQVSTLVDALKMDLPKEKVIQDVNFIVLKHFCGSHIKEMCKKQCPNTYIFETLFTLQELGSTGSRTALGRFRVAGVAVLAANRLAHWSRQSKLVLNSHNTQSGITNLLVDAGVEPSDHVTFKGK